MSTENVFTSIQSRSIILIETEACHTDVSSKVTPCACPFLRYRSVAMEQELIKMLFELTVEGNLIALKKVVEKHPNIHLSDCWTKLMSLNTKIVSIDSAVSRNIADIL